MISVTPQPFESAILGGAVCRLGLDGDLDDGQLARVLAPLLGDGLALAWCRIPEGDPRSAVLLAAGFRHVETLVTLRRPLTPGMARPAGIGPAGPADAEACARIGRQSFTFDRYHADGRLDADRAGEIKARWAANGISGRADAALVARQNGTVQGFILCMKAGDEAVIDLIAVGPEAQGQGVGRALVQGALAHYSGRAMTMRVGTQAANRPSLGLYSGLGFVESHRAATFHLVPS